MASHSGEQRTTQRPLAVLTALGITFFYIPIFVLIFFWPNESVLDEGGVEDTVVDAVEVFVIIISLAIAFWAMAVRRQWGRWFVAAPVAYIVGTLIWGHFFFVDEDPDDKIGVLIVACFFLSPLVIAVLLVSVGDSVKKYFGPSAEPGGADRRTRS